MAGDGGAAVDEDSVEFIDGVFGGDETRGERWRWGEGEMEWNL